MDSENTNDQQESLALDTGFEGATTGYMTAGKAESDEPEEKPGDDEATKDDDKVIDDESGEEDLKGSDETPDATEREKELLKAYTTKFRELSKKRGMVEMMEQIQSNPKDMIPWLAKKYGVNLGTEEKPSTKKADLKLPDLGNLQVNQDETMPAYINRVFATGMKELIEQLPQVISQSLEKNQGQGNQNFTPPDASEEDPIAKAIETLDKDHDDWPLYEDDMIKLLKVDPSLISKPSELYKQAKKGSELFKLSRKVAKVKKTEKKKFNTGVRGSGSRVISKSGKKMDFSSAWEQAKSDVLRRK